MRPAVKISVWNAYRCQKFKNRIFQKDIDSRWHTLLLACVSQFDTMHPSVSLGANFNDSIIHIRPKKKAHYFRPVGNNVLFNFSWCQSVQAAPVSDRLLRYSTLQIRCVVPSSIRGCSLP